MLNDNKTDRPIKPERRGLPLSYIGLLRHNLHIFIRTIRGVIRKMSNETVPVLQHIDCEEHYNACCCVKFTYTKIINGR